MPDYSEERDALKLWGSFNRGGYPGEGGSGDMDPDSLVSRGTPSDLEPVWPDEVKEVERLLLEMYQFHEDWMSRQLRRVVRMEYISRMRDDVIEARSAGCGLSRTTYYRRLEQVHEWLYNNLQIDLGRKVG